MHFRQTDARDSLKKKAADEAKNALLLLVAYMISFALLFHVYLRTFFRHHLSSFCFSPGIHIPEKERKSVNVKWDFGVWPTTKKGGERMLRTWHVAFAWEVWRLEGWCVEMCVCEGRHCRVAQPLLAPGRRWFGIPKRRLNSFQGKRNGGWRENPCEPWLQPTTSHHHYIYTEKKEQRVWAKIPTRTAPRPQGKRKRRGGRFGGV